MAWSDAARLAAEEAKAAKKHLNTTDREFNKHSKALDTVVAKLRLKRGTDLSANPKTAPHLAAMEAAGGEVQEGGAGLLRCDGSDGQATEEVLSHGME